MNNYEERPTVCPKCNNELKYGRMKDFGLKEYMSGYCYYCKKCNNYIVTHKNDKKKAIGTIEDSSTKYMRAKCHEKMDKLWSTSRGRRYYYRRLAHLLNIEYDDCHFGYMNKEQLEKAYNLIDSIPRKDFL